MNGTGMFSHSASTVQRWKLRISRSRFTRLFAYLFLFVFFVHETQRAYTFFMLRQMNNSVKENTHCRDMQEPKEPYCDLSTAKRFDKFLMFVTDCWPIQHAKDVLEHYKEHSNTFYVDIPGAKYSHAIYTSYLTGQLPTNYKGDPILSDHWVKGLNRNEFSLRYIGPEWSFLAILGKDNYNKLFDEVRIEKEPLNKHFQHAYPFFFESYGKIQPYLNSLKSSGQSMIAHSGVFDHVQHGEHLGLGPLGEQFPRTERMAKTMNTDFKSLKNWIDQNPDYLLILMSDHGVDEWGPGGYRMHGTSEDGNEPFLLLYNPSLSSFEKRIDIVDVAPTLVFYLKDMEIPANSIGVTHAHFGPNETNLECQSLQQNLVQLNQAANERGQTFDSSKLKQFVNLGSSCSANDVEQLRDFASEVKSEMYKDFSQSPTAKVILHSFVSVVTLCFILFKFNRSAIMTYLSYGDRSALFFHLWHFFIIYGLMLLQLLFCWWNWKWAHDGGYAFRTLSPALAILIILHARWSAKEPPRPNPRESRKPLADIVLISGIEVSEQAIYRCEQINIGIFFLTSSFSDLLAFFDIVPFLPEVATIIAFFFFKRIWKHRGVSWWLFLAGLVLSSLYSFTSEVSWLYIFHLHIFALLTFLLSVGLPIYLMATNQMENLPMPITLVLFLLYKDSFVNRILLMSLNYQYQECILPCLETLQTRLSTLSNHKKEPYHIYLASLAYQAGIAYAINQIFFVFMFNFGDKINLDVHPFVGRIGMGDYDVYPSFSAFLMTFHKYGIFALFAAYAFKLTYFQVEEGRLKGSKVGQPQSPTNRMYLSDLMTVSFLFLFTCCCLGMYLMFQAATRHHPLEQGVATTLITGTTGSVLTLFHTVRAFHLSKHPTHSVSSKD